MLNNSSRDEHASTKSPVGLGDMTGNNRKELVFADTEGVLKYSTTYLEQAPDNPISTLTVDGDPVTVSRHHGIISTHFPERVEGEFRYGGDSTPPDVTIVAPTPDGHTAGSVPLSVTADEPVTDWSYSLDGGPRRSFTPNTSFSIAAGTHTVTVYATDRVGNVDATTRTFQVDRRPSTEDPTPSPTPAPPPTVDTPTPTPTGTVATPTPTVGTPTPSPTPTASPTPNETASPTPTTDDRGVFPFLEGGFNWWLLLLLFATMVVLAVLEIHLIDQQD
jgi:hypothetical protein